jgi:hypothetical protein
LEIHYQTHDTFFSNTVGIQVFIGLAFTHFGVELSQTTKKWFGIDGKELRSSILAGHTRAYGFDFVLKSNQKLYSLCF